MNALSMRVIRFWFALGFCSLITTCAASSLAAQYTLTCVGPGIDSAINASGQLTWFNGHAIIVDSNDP